MMNVDKKVGYDIILLAGQSNAEGNGRGEVASPYQPEEDIMMMKDTQRVCFVKNSCGSDELSIKEPWFFSVRTAEESVEEGKTYGNFSLSFAKEYIKGGLLAADRKLLIVNATVGGTGFSKEQWGVGDVLYRRLTDMTDAALCLKKNNRIVAFLWHQGEHDAFEHEDWSYEERRGFYYAKLKELVETIRRRYAASNVPFIAGDFVAEWRDKNAVACKAVLDATKAVCEEIGHAAVVSSEGLLSNNQKNGDGDGIHFCRESLYELGQRYFEAYLACKE